MATIPTMDTFVAGEKVTAAKLNRNIRDTANFNFSPPMVSISKRANPQALTQNGWTKINLETVDYDTDSMWDVTNQQVVVKTAGLYIVTANTANNQSGGWFLCMAGPAGATANANLEVVRGQGTGSPASHSSQAATKTVRLAVNDVLSLYAYTNTASTTTVQQGANCPFLQLTWVAK